MDLNKLLAFDLEIAKEIPTFATDWQRYEPLGISCLALVLSGGKQALTRQGVPQMEVEACRQVVHELQEYVSQGYTIVTWNGCKFDFNVLAQESGMVDECARLALEHIDLMLMVTFTRGHFLSLQAALDGAGLGGKLKRVMLSDGTVMADMDGSKAPGLWAAGERSAVLAYLEADVLQLLELAQTVARTKSLRWVSRSGNRQHIPIPSMLPVRECFNIPKPDVSWQRNPPRRIDFVSWMPEEILKAVFSG